MLYPDPAIVSDMVLVDDIHYICNNSQVDTDLTKAVYQVLREKLGVDSPENWIMDRFEGIVEWCDDPATTLEQMWKAAYDIQPTFVQDTILSHYYQRKAHYNHVHIRMA